MAIKIVNINPFFRQLSFPSTSLGNISRMLRELRLSLLTLVNKNATQTEKRPKEFHQLQKKVWFFRKLWLKNRKNVSDQIINSSFAHCFLHYESCPKEFEGENEFLTRTGREECRPDPDFRHLNNSWIWKFFRKMHRNGEFGSFWVGFVVILVLLGMF